MITNIFIIKEGVATMERIKLDDPVAWNLNRNISTNSWFLIKIDKDIEKYIYFLALITRRVKSNNTTVSVSIPRTQILVFKYHSPLKGNQSPWLILRTGIRKILLYQKVQTCSKTNGDGQKNTEVLVRDSHWSNLRQSAHCNK